MQRCVNVIGVGMSPFRPARVYPDMDDLVAATVRQALADAGLPASSLTSIYAASDMPEGATLQRALDRCGMQGIALRHEFPEHTDNNQMLACAHQAILAGQAEAILVLGVQGQGLVLPAVEPMGVAARAYMARYQARCETFAMIAVKARQHAAYNPQAAFNQLMTLEQVLEAPMLAEPLTRPQWAWPTVGVAAVVLCSGEFASRHCQGPLVRILGQASVSPRQVVGVDLASPFADVGYDIHVAAARELYEQTGRGPEDIAVCELHDSSTLSELLLYEALGLCCEGSAEKFVEEGDNTYGGNLVVNPGGGLLSLGQAGAASALAQCVELVQQLRGSAGRRQVANARIALQHQAGSDGTVITTLYQRD